MGTKSLEVSAGGKGEYRSDDIERFISELVLTLPTNVLEDHSRDFLKNADILDFLENARLICSKREISS